MALDVTTVTVAGLGIIGTASGAVIAASATKAAAREETDRLLRQYREDERRNRQGTYHRMIATLQRFDAIAIGYAPSDVEYEAVLAEYDFLHGGVLLFGTEAVKDAMGPVTELFEKVGSTMDANNIAVSFARGYKPLRKPIIEAQGNLIRAMAEDANTGIHLPSPDTTPDRRFGFRGRGST